MTPSELMQEAIAAKKAGRKVHLVTPPCYSAVKGFPRGRFLCEGPEGRVKAYDPAKIIVFLATRDWILVEVQAAGVAPADQRKAEV